MMAWVGITALVAQSEWIRRFRLRSNSDTSSILMALALFVGAIALVWIASRWIRLQERRREHCPRALFRELARAHGLSSADRNLLLRLAAQQNVYNPAAVFVEPHRFNTDQPGAHLEGDALHIQRLHDKLFGSLAKTTEPPRS